MQINSEQRYINNTTLFKHNQNLTLKSVEKDLGTVLDDLFEAFEIAKKKYDLEMASVLPPARLPHFKSTIFNMRIIESIQAKFPNEYELVNRRVILYVKGYMILFKKLDENFMPSNIKTISNDLILNQKYARPILFFGYQRDAIGGISNPKIVYINGVLQWVLDVNGKEMDISPNQIPTEKATPKVRNPLSDSDVV